IGYIRIPNYAPPSQAVALTQFETEMAFFQDNTDGLIVDEMRNTGGNLCFGENIAARLIPNPFRTTASEIRATRTRVNRYYAKRGLLVGFRTNGAGGNKTSFAAGAYSESSAGMTLALQVRPNPVVTSDFPTTSYIENVGVRPDVEIDYMKRENLLQRGKPFVD